MDIGKSLAFAADWVDKEVVPGLAIAVAHHGEIIGEYYGGQRSVGGDDAVDETTLYCLTSITKVYTAAAFMHLVDRGAIGLDEPARRVIPTFSGPQKRDVTFRDILCHRSGLPTNDPQEFALWEARAGFEEFARSAAAVELTTTQYKQVVFSNPAYWILGAAISEIAGTSLSEFLATEFLARLGLNDTFITPPRSEYDRIVRHYGSAKLMNLSYGRNLGSPSTGMFSTARDVVTFANMFINPPTTTDQTIVLSDATITQMTTNQTDSLPGGIEDFRTWDHCSWGLGWEIKGEKLNHWTGDLTSPATICHIGESGSLVWADPETGITCALLTNRDLATGWTDIPARWARFNNLLVATLTKH